MSRFAQALPRFTRFPLTLVPANVFLEQGRLVQHETWSGFWIGFSVDPTWISSFSMAGKPKVQVVQNLPLQVRPASQAAYSVVLLLCKCMHGLGPAEVSLGAIG